MPSKHECLLAVAASLGLLLLINLPLLLAFNNSDNGQVFAGIIFNPVDGQSYLAKMRQGFDGNWSFVLPYTARPGDGAPINLYYLFLGHVARWTNISLVFMFHSVRLAASLLLLLQLFSLSKLLFPNAFPGWVAFLLAALGSGLGWIAVLFGRLTPDFWMSEAFPFLAIQANVHFPLGLALQIHFILPRQRISASRRLMVLDALLGLLLALIYPFGFAVAGSVLAIQAARSLWLQSGWRSASQRLIPFGSLGGSLLLFQWLAVRGHPALSVWNAQNRTPLPPVTDLLIAFSPALILAMLYFARRDQAFSKLERSLAIWLAAGFLLAFIPSNLQRRFLSGAFIPLAFFAVKGLALLVSIKAKRRMLLIALLLLSLPTSLIGSASGLAAIQTQDKILFLSKDEAAAMDWLSGNAQEGALVAASPSTGLYLPVGGDLRVLYGHPFETIQATQHKTELEAFFRADIDQAEFLAVQQVDFVFYGPREQTLGPPPAIKGWGLIYTEGDVFIMARAK